MLRLLQSNSDKDARRFLRSPRWWIRGETRAYNNEDVNRLSKHGMCRAEPDWWRGFYLVCCDGWRELYYVMRGTKNTGNMFHLGSRKGCRETWDEWVVHEDVLELDASFPSLSHLPVQTRPPSGWTPEGFPSSFRCCATGLMSSTVHGKMFPYVRPASQQVGNRLFRSFQWLKEIKNQMWTWAHRIPVLKDPRVENQH